MLLAPAPSGDTALANSDIFTPRLVPHYLPRTRQYIHSQIVNFTDGRTIEVPAGHTNFVPTSLALRPKTPFSWNVTFVEHEPGCEQLPSRQLDDRRRCLPEEFRSVFTAEVTLEEGNVVQPGKLSLPAQKAILIGVLPQVHW